MTEEEWTRRTDQIRLPTERKLRLFLCAVCRRILYLTLDERCHRAVETAERYEDGEATFDELRAAATSARMAIDASLLTVQSEALRLGSEIGEWLQATRASKTPNPQAASFIAAQACQLPLWLGSNEDQLQQLQFLVLLTMRNCAVAGDIGELINEQREFEEQHRIFLDVHPLRLVNADPAWLTTTVVSLAKGIYQDRTFDRMPILADALQDAGCDNEDILSHCRSDAPHVRGCWVVDLLTGRK